VPGNFEAGAAWMLKQEGGFVTDSGGPTKYGISGNAHPGIDIKNLSQAQAVQIYHDDYWKPMGIDSLPDNMKIPVFDAAINEGVAKAKVMLEQSGNDPQAFQALREQHYRSLAEANPGKYAQYLPTWLKRIGAAHDPDALSIPAGRQMVQDINLGEPPSSEEMQGLGSNLLDKIRATAQSFAEDESGALGKKREASATEENPEGTLTPEEEVASHFAGVTKRPGIGDLIAKTSHDLYLEMIDPDAPLGKLVDAVRDGGSLDDARNPIFLRRLADASDNTSQYALERNMVDIKGNVTGPSLKTILQPFDGETGANTFWTYAGARWAAEKAEQGKETGIPLPAALKVIENHHAKYGEAFQQLQDFQNQSLAYLRDSGIMSSEAYDAAVTANRARIPGYRTQDLLHEPRAAGGKGDVRDPIKGFKGSDLEVQNVHESLIKDVYLRMSLANHNLANQAARDAGLATGLARVEETAAAQIPHNIEDVDGKMDPDMDVSVAQLAGKSVRADQVPVFENGQLQHVVFDDPDLAPLLRGMNSVQLTTWQKLVGNIANFQRSMITLAPAFPVHLLGYDVPFQFITKPGFRNTVAQALSGIGHTFFETDTWDQWMRQGAPDRILTGLSKSKYLQQVMKGDQDPHALDGIFNSVKSSYDVLKAWSMKMSQVMPVGRYAQGLKEGVSQEALAYASSEAPFHRSGAMGPAAKAINTAVPFFTAYLNGLEKTMRSLAGVSKPGEGEIGWDPKLMATTWAKAAAIITVPMIYQELTDGDKQWRKAVPDWVKDNSLLLHFGPDWETTDQKDEAGNPITIPHGVTMVYKYPPLLSLLFGGLPRRMVSAFVEGHSDAFNDFGKSVGASLLPPGGMYPSAFLPFMEHAANYSFFKGKRIVPDSIAQSIPGQYAEQYTPYSTTTARAIAKFASEIPLVRGMGLAPPIVDNYIDSWAGTMGSNATHWVDQALQMTGKRQNLPSEGWTDNPLWASFYERHPGFSSETVQDFDARQQRFTAVHGLMAQAIKEDDFAKFQAILATHPNEAAANRLTLGRDNAPPANYQQYADAKSALGDIPEATQAWMTASRAVLAEEKVMHYIATLPGRQNPDNPDLPYMTPDEKRVQFDQHGATLSVMADRANALAKEAGIK
jgi:hypothetical protein